MTEVREELNRLRKEQSDWRIEKPKLMNCIEELRAHIARLDRRLAQNQSEKQRLEDETQQTEQNLRSELRSEQGKYQL